MSARTGYLNSLVMCSDIHVGPCPEFAIHTISTAATMRYIRKLSMDRTEYGTSSSRSTDLLDEDRL
jgi:hypothetical protein